MDRANSDLQLYRQRWKAVEEIERQELRAMPIEEHWRQLNSIARLASGLGLQREDDEMPVYRRWARLKGAA